MERQKIKKEIKHAGLNCAVKISQKKAIHNFQLT